MCQDCEQRVPEIIRFIKSTLEMEAAPVKQGESDSEVDEQQHAPMKKGTTPMTPVDPPPAYEPPPPAAGYQPPPAAGPCKQIFLLVYDIGIYYISS